MSADDYSADIIAVAKGLGLSEPDARLAAEIGIAAAIGESSLLMYANDGSSTDIKYGSDPPEGLTQDERDVAAQSMNYPHDRVGNNLDSMGLFQQRPGADWGEPHELMDSTMSATKFYCGAGYNDGLMDLDGWQQMEPGYAAWSVQKCAPEDMHIYETAGAEAVKIVDRLWGDGTSGDWFDTASRDEIAAVVAEQLNAALLSIAITVWTKGINEYAANELLASAAANATSAAQSLDSMPVRIWTQGITDDTESGKANALLAKAANK